ncbi:MAG: anaphase promoting complex subunit 5 [Candelina mexicana]|nr:MAG: anaphase promoting complex subunit 5 [Candelina mexicana]
MISIDELQKALISQPSAIPGRTMWDLLLARLWKLNSFDALHVFFESLPGLLVKPGKDQDLEPAPERGNAPSEDRIVLSRTSLLGVFVSHAQLEFERLQFHDSVGLWKNLIAYREPTLGMWRKRNSSAGKMSFDTNLQSWGQSWGHGLTELVYGELAEKEGFVRTVSTDDVERLLEFQVEEMQKFGNRIPNEVKAQLRGMAESRVTIPSLSHYIKFLDSWRAGDYPSSFDNLHRYFDYTMHNRDRTFYQYALLNLAILHADFGCHGEAIAAMQETISSARENKDIACLNFSLSWLYHFTKTHPQAMSEIGKGGMLGTEREGLAFLKAKAKESGMWSLLSTSLLSEAKIGLINGESVPIAFENIIKASHLIVTKNIKIVVGPQMLIQSSIFGRLDAPVEMVQRGRFDDAMARMDEIDVDSLRTLKHYQYWATFSGLLKLTHELHRNNLVAADHLLAQLQSSPASDPDIAVTISMLQINLLSRRQSYDLALSALEDLATKLQNEGQDIYYRIRLLSMKAYLLDKCGRAEKGFSVALRAASLAHRARLLPALWEAMGAVSNVLINLEEFEAAAKLLGSIMPQVSYTLSESAAMVHECEDRALSAQTYSLLVDSHMGLAGQQKPNTAKRNEYMNKALEFIDCSFAEYSRIQDINGQCEMMAKKATIMHLVGDLMLANDYATKYLDLKKEATSSYG